MPDEVPDRPLKRGTYLDPAQLPAELKEPYGLEAVAEALAPRTQEERREALQELAELSQELGLYDTCAFCSQPLPCPSHRPGG